jgi:SAM-dependent methyltransferase
MSGPAADVDLALPYSHFAADYDSTLGLPFFHHTRSNFERLVRRYGISFRSAADIGCGTGLFARHLKLSRAIPIFGVDLSEPMLRVAARNCCGMDVQLLRQDIRRLHLPRKVDLITANFDTLNHMVTTNDLLETLRRVVENLNRGGHFIFDLVTNCPPLHGGTLVRHFGRKSRRVTQTVSIDPARNLIRIFVAINSYGNSYGSPTSVVEHHCERFFSLPELGRALHAAGLVVLGIHDSRTLAMAAGCPPRVVVVARKKE